MARVNTTGLNEIIRRFEAQKALLPKTVDKALKQGGEVMKEYMQAELAPHKDTGDLQDSLKVSAVKTDGGTKRVDIQPDGYDSKGVPNPIKGNVLEHGRPGHQPATPWAAPAAIRAEGAVVSAMEQVILDGLTGDGT